MGVTRDPAVPPGLRVVRVPVAIDYGVRAMTYIARHGSAARPVHRSDITDAEGLGRRFLSTILIALAHAELIESRRGALGGYWLSRRPEQVSVLEIYLALDGKPEHEPHGSPSVNAMWLALESSLRDRLRDLTLAEIMGDDATASPPSALLR